MARKNFHNLVMYPPKDRLHDNLTTCLSGDCLSLVSQAALVAYGDSLPRMTYLLVICQAVKLKNHYMVDFTRMTYTLVVPKCYFFEVDLRRTWVAFKFQVDIFLLMVAIFKYKDVWSQSATRR